MIKLKHRFAPLAAIALALGLHAAGCAPENTVIPSERPTLPPATDTHDDAGAEAIAHMAEGPAAPVTAVAFDAMTGVPLVGSDHKRYDIALVASDSQNVGKVKLDSATALDYTFFLNADVALAIKDAAGEAVAIERTLGPIASSSIAQHCVAELGVGRYFLYLGPTRESSLSLVVEGGAHDHEH
ncbi:MAG TPA: hypothetical protein V6D00_12825 [Pantanalinema sp.]